MSSGVLCGVLKDLLFRFEDIVCRTTLSQAVVVSTFVPYTGRMREIERTRTIKQLVVIIVRAQEDEFVGHARE